MGPKIIAALIVVERKKNAFLANADGKCIFLENIAFYSHVVDNPTINFRRNNIIKLNICMSFMNVVGGCEVRVHTPFFLQKIGEASIAWYRLL